MKLTLFIFAWIILAIVSMGLGQYYIEIRDVAQILIGEGSDEIAKDVVLRIRLPRVLMSSLCGGILALSGMCLQGVFKNPLVGPHIVGVSTGAAFGGVLAILFAFNAFFLIVSSFVFGVVALLLVYFLASIIARSDVFSLILSGIVINGFFAALISLIKYLADAEDVLPNIVFWLLGSFVNIGYDKLLITFCVALPCVIVLILMRWRFNLLSLNDDDLKALGINVNLLRVVILSICTILIAGQVSMSGNIGWVGLVVPHMTRFISGHDHVKSMPVCFVVGAIFMLCIDDISRNLITGEIPLGILSALIGTPVFALLLIKSRKNVQGN